MEAPTGRKIRERTKNTTNMQATQEEEVRYATNVRLNYEKLLKETTRKSDLRRIKDTAKAYLGGFLFATCLVGCIASVKPLLALIDRKTDFNVEDSRLYIPTKDDTKILSVCDLNYLMENIDSAENRATIYSSQSQGYDIYLIKIETSSNTKFDIGKYSTILELFKSKDYLSDIVTINKYINDALSIKSKKVSSYKDSIEVLKNSDRNIIVFKFARKIS